jgi:adenylosuccinate lyase
MSNSPHDTYTSPLATRNASAEMLRIWSARHKFQTWRRIWLAVAEAQCELGLPVSKEQVEELRANLEVMDEDLEKAAEYEGKLRHDVMAHVHAWGDRCPKARGIIHLGMTSEDVGSNADLLILEEAGRLLMNKTVRVIVSLGDASDRHKTIPTLGFTHYQAAQPLTVGRRCANWASDLHQAYIHFYVTHYEYIPFRGLRGATGTQASFLELCAGDGERVDQLEELFFQYLWGHEASHVRKFDLTGQTYPRVADCFVLADLASVASVLHKIATDIRLLSNRKELDEPFEEKQIGSSAMPYKRNPMRCERICGLSRFVWNLVGNAYDTAATQWLERTLDDSANRRLSLPEAFLALDGALDLMHNVASGLIVHEATVRANLMAELPFMATENLMMEAVKKGRDRQEVHEAIRQHAQAAGWRVKEEGKPNDLIERLRGEPLLAGVDLDRAMDPMLYVGRSVEQTERFLKEVVEPLRQQYGEAIEKLGGSGPKV